MKVRFCCKSWTLLSLSQMLKKAKPNFLALRKKFCGEEKATFFFLIYFFPFFSGDFHKLVIILQGKGAFFDDITNSVFLCAYCNCRAMDNCSIEETLLSPKAEQAQEEGDLKARILEESNKIWRVAMPSVISRVSSFGTIVVTQSFIGHINPLDLAGYALVQTLSVRFVNGILVRKKVSILNLKVNALLV